VPDNSDVVGKATRAMDPALASVACRGFLERTAEPSTYVEKAACSHVYDPGMKNQTLAGPQAPMNVSEAVRTRRAVKHYDAHHRLEDQELRSLLSAAALAPTAYNIQNRHVVVVLDQETKGLLQAAAFGQEQVRDASVVFVLAGDLKAHRRTDRYLRNAPAPVRMRMEPMIADLFEGNHGLLREEAARSVGMAGMSLMLSAKELGYDSCPMTGFDAKRVSDLLALDDDHPPLMLVVVGKASEQPHPRLGLLDLEESFSLDRFDNRAITGEVDAT
jgi:nitroreductase